MFTETNIVARRDVTVEAAKEVLTLRGPGSRVNLVFAHWSEEEVADALQLIEHLEAGLDNIVSFLRQRQDELERERERYAVGGGAGASVQADRG